MLPSTPIMRHMSKSCFLTFFLLCCTTMPLHASEPSSNIVNAAIQEAEEACMKLFTPPQWTKGELIFYNQPSLSIIAGVIIFTCIGYLVAFLLLKRYKKTFLTLDRKGIILEDGKRILWKHIERVEEKDIKRTSYSSDLAKAYDIEQSKRKMKEKKFDELNDLENKTRSNPYQDYVLKLTIRYPKGGKGKRVRTVKLKKGIGGMSSYEAIKELMELIHAHQEAYNRTKQGEKWDVEYAKSTLKNNFPHLGKQALMLKNINTRIKKFFVIVLGMITLILCAVLCYQFKKPWEKVCIIGNMAITDGRDHKRYEWGDVIFWEKIKNKNVRKIDGIFVKTMPNNVYKPLVFSEEIIPPSIWKEEVLDAIKSKKFLKN